jgi:heme exporter protein D
MNWVNWGSLDAFLTMGGYGFYVWGSFGLCALVMVLEPWQVLLRHRQAQNRLRHKLNHPSESHAP